MSEKVIGPIGSRDQGFLRSATENLMVEVVRFKLINPFEIFKLWVVIGVDIVQDKLAESVPCRPVHTKLVTA